MNLKFVHKKHKNEQNQHFLATSSRQIQVEGIAKKINFEKAIKKVAQSFEKIAKKLPNSSKDKYRRLQAKKPALWDEIVDITKSLSTAANDGSKLQRFKEILACIPNMGVNGPKAEIILLVAYGIAKSDSISLDDRRIVFKEIINHIPNTRFSHDLAYKVARLIFTNDDLRSTKLLEMLFATV